jgi:hypothetical protein
MSYLPDRWLYPIVLTNTNNVLRIFNVATSTTVSATVPAGTYYHGYGLPSGYSSFPIAVATAMTTALGRTITYTYESPAGQTTTILALSSIRFIDAGAGFRFQFSDALFTLDNRLVGFPSDAANTGNNPSPAISVLGTWQSFNMLDGAASDKRRTERRELYSSTGVLYSTTRQHSVRDDRKVRRFAYDYVPGLHVYGSLNRAEDPAYRALAGLANKDNANAFEQVWRAASDLGDIIIVHDDSDPEVLASPYHEIARLELAEQREDFRNCLTDLSLGGELYRIEVDMLILGGNYDY